MPMQKFIFDGPNRLFIARPEFVNTDGVMDVDVQVDLYSDWKEVVKEVDNLKYAQAMRSVGGDPISGTQNLGDTYFLLNGWRIRPAEADHRLRLDGNIFTDPFGDSITVPTAGAFTVIVENTVSNLVDSSVSRLDLTELQPAVYVDAVAGNDSGTGTPTNPVKTVAAARVIADANNLSTYRFRGTLSLDQDHEAWTFEGIAAHKRDRVELNGFSVDASQFTDCFLVGAAIGSIDAENCGLAIITGLAGLFRHCGFESDFTSSGDLDVAFVECYDAVAGLGLVTFRPGPGSHAVFRSFQGGIRIADFVDPYTEISFEMDPGRLVLDPTCTAGNILVRGVGQLEDNSNGTVVDSVGVVYGEDIALTRKLLQNRTHTDPNTGKQTVFDDDDNTVLFEADLFEDVGGLTPYGPDSQEINRRNRLS